MTLVDLQSGIAELGPRRAGHRFPAELRHALLAHVAQARSQGVAWTTLATQTGIRATSLSRMVAGEQHRTSPMPQPTLVPVVASAPIVTGAPKQPKSGEFGPTAKPSPLASGPATLRPLDLKPSLALGCLTQAKGLALDFNDLADMG